jgi:hypothetical protein
MSSISSSLHRHKNMKPFQMLMCLLRRKLFKETSLKHLERFHVFGPLMSEVTLTGKDHGHDVLIGHAN